MPISRLYLLLLLLPLTACDQISSLDGSKAREADGVAVGSACRQAGRAIEDCFTMNPDAVKASVFAGWKEMNDYMVSNKLETVKPEIPRPDAKDAKGGKDGGKKADAHADADDHGAPAGKAPIKMAIAVPEVAAVAPAIPASAAEAYAPPAVAPGEAPAAAPAPGRPPVAIATPVTGPPPVAAAPVPNTSTPGRPPVAPGSPTLVIPGSPPVASVPSGSAPGTPPAPTPVAPKK